MQQLRVLKELWNLLERPPCSADRPPFKILGYATLFSLAVSSFFFNATPTTEIYTLSLHDALPIYADGDVGDDPEFRPGQQQLFIDFFGQQADQRFFFPDGVQELPARDSLRAGPVFDFEMFGQQLPRGIE